MPRSHMEASKDRKPIVGNGYQVHRTTGVEKTELQIPVSPPRLRSDVRRIRFTKIAADDDEVGAGCAGRVLTASVAIIEIDFRNVAAATRIEIGTGSISKV